MRPLSRVDTSVYLQGTDMTERLPTDVSHVGSLAGVQAAAGGPSDYSAE